MKNPIKIPKFVRFNKRDVSKGQIESSLVIQLGQARVKRRSLRWFNFFAMLPLWGNLLFYIEGKREEKDIDKGKIEQRVGTDKKNKKKGNKRGKTKVKKR